MKTGKLSPLLVALMCLLVGTIAGMAYVVVTDEASIINEANNRGKDIFEKASDDWLKAGSKLVTFYKNGYI